MTRPRAADDFAAIRARMEELRPEREKGQAAEGELQRARQTYRVRDVRWCGEISTGPRQVYQSASGKQLDRDRR